MHEMKKWALQCKARDAVKVLNSPSLPLVMKMKHKNL